MRLAFICRYGFYLCAFFSLMSVACSSEELSSLKIVNGVVSEQDSLVARHTVALTDPYTNEAYCTGSVIAKRWVLTAAHCFEEDANSVIVSFGLGFLADKDVVTIIGQLHPHPDFNTIEHPTTHSEENDIALIELDSDIPKFVTPVALANSDDVILGAEVILAGYGITGPEMQLAKLEMELADLLENQLLDLKAESEENSQDSMLNDPRVLELQEKIAKLGLEISKGGRSFKTLRETKTTINMITDTNVIIYKSENGLNSSCHGDSGGPMYLISNGSIIQLGVTHGPYLISKNSLENCQETGVYTNVTSFREFISETMNQH